MDTEKARRIFKEWLEAWVKDDIEAVIDGLSETVVFYAPQNEYNKAIPYLGKKIGRQAVVEAFKVRAETTELLKYDLLEFIVDGNKACIISHTQELCKLTQQVFEIEDAQLIVLDEDGKISYWSFYFDPNTEVAAFKGDFNNQLIQAVQKNELEVVKFLLEIGANVNTRNTNNGLTVLMMAASQCNSAMVQLLLDAGADPYTVDSVWGSSVLHQACQGGCGEVVELLIKAGAFVDAVSAGGKQITPLHYALSLGHTECAEILLNAGANLNFHNENFPASNDIFLEQVQFDNAVDPSGLR
ncbi:ankyrin repeat domain-containing protein [Umezakia ovalisporum]|jgi:ketosteroid isomerase-like protein|uniref:ankyrin repeat domain-containing protein n=1 Tax=Umezakia ovalisporum TaxID=75695 RepID=UPI0035BB5349|nr:hypothetical protein [Nostoc sp. RI_552]